MSDIFNRTTQRPDGTLFDVASIGQTLGGVGAALIVLCVLVKPEASHGLGVLGRLLFWSLHVGLGLLALKIASNWLAHKRWLPDNRIAAVLLTALSCTIIIAPGFLALEQVFAPYIVDLDPDTYSNSLIVALAFEAIGLAPWFIIIWALINLPILMPGATFTSSLSLQNQLSPNPETPDKLQELDKKNSLSHDSSPADIDETDEHPTTYTSQLTTTKDAEKASSKAAAKSASKTSKIGFISSLPSVVGTDIIAVSSDMHYLNVWASDGRAKVLGKLRDVEKELGNTGMLVHRSHWVAHAHVRRLVGTAANGVCLLSNELRVPVSRRRWKAVRAQYGLGVVQSNKQNT